MPTVTSTTGKLVSFRCAQCREDYIVDRARLDTLSAVRAIDEPLGARVFCSDACVRAYDVSLRLRGRLNWDLTSPRATAE